MYILVKFRSFRNDESRTSSISCLTPRPMKGVDGTNIQESNKTVNESVKSQFSSASFGVAVIENNFFNSMGKSNFSFCISPCY